MQAQILLIVNRICLHPSVYCFENASLYLIYGVILLAIPSTPNNSSCVWLHIWHHDVKAPEQDMTLGLNSQATNRFPDSLFTQMTLLLLLFISEFISISGKEVAKKSPYRG